MIQPFLETVECGAPQILKHIVSYGLTLLCRNSHLLFVRSVGNTGSSFAHFNAVISARVRPNETRSDILCLTGVREY